MALTQAALAKAMGVARKHVNERCNDRRKITAATALTLAGVFGNSPDFWLNVQRRSDLREATSIPRQRKRIGRAKPLEVAARSGARRSPAPATTSPISPRRADHHYLRALLRRHFTQRSGFDQF